MFPGRRTTAKNPRKDFGAFLRSSGYGVEGEAVLLSAEQFAKIKSATAVCDPNVEARKWRKEREAELKMKMVELENLRKENKKADISEDENEDVKKMNDEIRAKAELKLLEMDEDVRKLNELITYVKCQAVRDEQVKEKHKKLKEMRAEDVLLQSRLEEFHRKRDEQINAQKKSQKESIEKFSASLREQIESKEAKKIQLLHQREQEASHVNEIVTSFHDLEKRNQLIRKQDQQRIRNELLQSIGSRQVQRQQERSRDTEAERKIQRELKEQLDMAAQRSSKVEEMRKEKQLILENRILEHAKRQLLADKAAKDSVRDRKNLEALEAKWRAQEVEAAKKKLLAEEELKEFRRKQLQEKIEMKRELDAKERQLMAAIEKHQRKLQEKEMEETKRKFEMNGAFTEAIRSQVCEKLRRQRNKLTELTEFYKDRNADDDKRKQTVAKYKQQRLAHLRSGEIPENLIDVVARKFKF